MKRKARRRRILLAAAAVLAVAGVAVALSRLVRLGGVLERAEHASPGLLALAAAFEALSFAGYVVLVRMVFRPEAPRISWKASMQLTLAGVTATRLVTAGGVGGIALTLWTLRAAGLDTRAAGRRLGAFLVLLYSLFFGAMLLAGAGLWTGALPGGTPPGVSLAAAVVGAGVIALALAATRIHRVAAVTFVGDSVRLALELVRARPALMAAALAWWTFDVAVLWATFDVFGSPPPMAVLTLCYFLGQLAQVIPVPGGIGPVEGGMIGAFAASGVPVSLAVVAVLAYQAVSTWLPAAPGVWAYAALRRRVAGWRTEVASGSAARG